MPFLFAATLAWAHLSAQAGFVKTVTGDDGVFTMQTGAHHLVAEGKPDVWLVGAAHIGDKAYYEALQKLLDAQDEVLFERVKPKAGEKVAPMPDPKAPKPIYEVLGNALGLDFQLNDINYNHPHWINSDLSMDDLDKLNAKESGGKANGFSQIEKLLDPNSPEAKSAAASIQLMTPGMRAGLKLGLIKKLSMLDTNTGVFDATTNDVILRARNDSVESYFSKSLAETPPPKSIAIFYGAMHQQGLEDDLISKYGYKVTETRWFSAATADTKSIDAAGQQILNLIVGTGLTPPSETKKS